MYEHFVRKVNFLVYAYTYKEYLDKSEGKVTCRLCRRDQTWPGGGQRKETRRGPLRPALVITHFSWIIL
jgi:hypothetical protein